MLEFTDQQKAKLRLFGVEGEILKMKFRSAEDRELCFKKILKDRLAQIKSSIIEKSKQGRNLLRELEDNIRSLLIELGFIEVATPTIIPQDFILKMGISRENPLWKQIIWISDGKKCLRPMLAPNLYIIMRKLRKMIGVAKIFEIGPCFRKERGRFHLTEFTMCNAVIYPASGSYEDRRNELLSLIDKLATSLGLTNYEIVEDTSSIYGKTIDILYDGVEIGSAVVGPVDIDANWKIDKPWIGVGIGLERILMVKHKSKRISPFSKSLEYFMGLYLGTL